MSEDAPDLGDISLTPAQHEVLKDHFHGSQEYAALRHATSRYLIIGSNSGDKGQRRIFLRDTLDERPEATAFRLEDFGLSPDEIHLWAAGFDLIAAHATHIVAVLEHFNGHTWELGLFYPDRRDDLWVLRRVYDDEETMRQRYDNPMAASYIEELLEYNNDRVIDWERPEELESAVDNIP